MKLTYIFHSGFAVETQSCVLVFDYWMDPVDCMQVILSKGKPVYVLVSHFHEDHFSREIFSWRQVLPSYLFYLYTLQGYLQTSQMPKGRS